MSVNNSNQYTEVNNEIHGEYKFSDSSFDTPMFPTKLVNLAVNGDAIIVKRILVTSNFPTS